MEKQERFESTQRFHQRCIRNAEIAHLVPTWQLIEMLELLLVEQRVALQIYRNQRPY
jgi:hypothetical protein